jgi:N utilization substance protein B
MKASRRHARELALQGLYQWQLAGGAADGIEAQLGDSELFLQADQDYFRLLLAGAIREAASLEAALIPFLDRPFNGLSPIERGILLLAGYELEHCLEVPYRVIINEAIELAKAYGGTDGHKYVNGVLDKLALAARSPETAR